MPRSKGIIVTMLGKVTSDVEVSEILPKLQPFFFSYNITCFKKEGYTDNECASSTMTIVLLLLSHNVMGLQAVQNFILK